MRYYINAAGKTNITPGSSRAVRIGLTARILAQLSSANAAADAIRRLC